MKRNIIGVLFILLLISLVLACAPAAPQKPTTPTPAPAPAAPAAPAKVTTLKVSYTMPKGKSVGGGLEWWGPEFEKRTSGRYKVELYPSNTLIAISALQNSIKARVAEIALMPIAMFPTSFPVSMLVTLPSVGFPGGTAERYQKQWEAWWEFAALPEVKNEFKDYRLLWPFGLDASLFVAKSKEIRSAADFKGMKIGGATGPLLKMVESQGGAQVATMAPETYMNMDKGVIDGAFLSFGMANDYNIHEIAKYYNTYEFSCGNLSLLMNLQAWNEMSPEDQKLLETSIRECTRLCAESMVTSTVAGKEKAVKAGRTIVEPTAQERAQWEKDAGCTEEQWMKEAQAAGITNPMAILDKYKQIRAKYIK